MVINGITRQIVGKAGELIGAEIIRAVKHVSFQCSLVHKWASLWGIISVEPSGWFGPFDDGMKAQAHGAHVLF